MIPLTFQYFILCHLIGDYYFQTQQMAARKQKELRALVVHCGLYSVPFLSAFILYDDSFVALRYWISLSLAHAILDFIKYFWSRRFSVIAKEYSQWLFLLDQASHLLLGFLVISVLALRLPQTVVDSEVWSLFLSWSAYLLLLFKPTNICFKLVFGKYQQSYHEEEVTERNIVQKKPLEETVSGAGALIGNLERMIMAIFLNVGQFAALAIVMTAKSITRYNKIAKEPAFAEYYLIGTLYSILVTLIGFFLFVYRL